MISQSSEIFVEAPFVSELQEAGLSSIQEKHIVANPTRSIIEFRKYQLQLGYDTVPRFLSIYSKALPSKLATNHNTTKLITVLVSDITHLNVVYEIWRHGDESTCGMTAMHQSRVASRNAAEWRAGIQEIAGLSVGFESSVLRPLDFSPLR